MKSLKNVLATLAFLFAFAAAFATAGYNSNSAMTEDTPAQRLSDCSDVVCAVDAGGPSCNDYHPDGICTLAIENGLEEK